MKQTKERPKPCLDALFEANEGVEMAVKLRHSFFRKGDVIMLKTVYSPVKRNKYAGNIVFETPLLQKKPKIVTPTPKIVKPN